MTSNVFLHLQDALPTNWPVQIMMTGGQPLTKSITLALDKLCKVIMYGYGSTEITSISFQTVQFAEKHIEFSCGTLGPGSGTHLKIVDENGTIVPVNTKGEVYVKSPGMFKEYFNDPRKTASAITEDGWYKTDDLGRITEYGELFVEGRMSNVIISGGLNVSPEFLETVLKSCPGVVETAIVPIPDDINYQVLCACAVTKKESDVTVDRLREFCESVHNDKPGLFTVLPKFYIILDSLPETESGKLSRKALEKMMREKFAA